MRDIIIHRPRPSDGMVISEDESKPLINTRGDQIRIVKLPEYIYQIYFDIAQMNHNKERAKNDIRIDLLRWARDKYPEYAVIGVQDYSADEARAINEKTGLNITWGLYIALALNAETRFGEITELLTEPFKQIEYGNLKAPQIEVPKQIQGQTGLEQKGNG